MINKLFHSNIEQKIVSNISKTKAELKIAVAWFTNPRIYEIIENLISKGILLELILCDDRINFSNPKVDFQKLIDLGANIRVSESPNLMHNKFCIIDGRILITGSYNWTLRAEQFNYENIIVSTDKQLINEFQDYFKLLSDKTKRVTNIPEIKFRNYLSEKEIELELGLEENETNYSKQIEPEESTDYSSEINTAIEHADLLYREAEHQNCIGFCKKMVAKYPAISEFYLSLASSYWRLNKINELIASAEKVIVIDNKNYDAYNLLGLGYARISGKEQQAIKNYNICIAEYPNGFTYLRNRSLCYIALGTDINIPNALREKYVNSAISDLDLIISTLKKMQDSELDYRALHTRAFAYYYRRKITLAKGDIDLALEKYSQIKDKFDLDKNELAEMKQLQKDLNRAKKAIS